MLVPYVREHQLRAEVEVTPSGVIDEEAAFAADECRDVSRGLRHPGVEDQLIELRETSMASKTISRRCGLIVASCYQPSYHSRPKIAGSG